MALQTMERIILDPRSESIDNFPLELTGRDSGHGIYLVEHSYPPAERASQWAKTSDTEGAKRAVAGLPDIRRIPVKVWVAEEAGLGSGTNLVTNPKAGKDITGVTTANGLTLERKILPVGTTVPLPMVPAWIPAETAFHGVGNADNSNAQFSIAVTNGRSYIFSTYLFILALGGASGLNLQVRSLAGTIKATSTAYATVGGGMFIRQSVPVTADATETWTFRIRQAGAGAADFYFTCVMIEEASAVSPYFDGDTPGANWSGTAHASTSVRVGDGLNRKRAVAALHDLEAKIEKLYDRQGTYKRVLPSGDALTFDVLEAKMPSGLADKVLNQGKQEVDLEFVCDPFPRRPEVSMPQRSEGAKPVLIGTEDAPGGDVPALGRLLITEDEAKAQNWFAWGVQVKDYDSSVDADLFYEAESRTPLSGAALASRSGASGAGNNVVRHDSLITDWQAILSTQAAGGGNHLRHVGIYNVYARVYDPNPFDWFNGKRVWLRLEWGQGELRSRELNPIAYPSNSEGWSIVPLGQVRLDKAVTGAQRWEARVLAKADAVGWDIDIDCLIFIPAEEGFGEAKAAAPAPAGVSPILGLDLFEQSGGALHGKAANIGTGTWVVSGDATDPFAVVDAENWVERNAGGDAVWTPCIARLGTGVAAGIDCAVRVWLPNPSAQLGGAWGGPMIRYVDDSNWIAAIFAINGPWSLLILLRRTSGGGAKVLGAVGANRWPVHFLRITADANGVVKVYDTVREGQWGKAKITTIDTTLATGGVLDDGGYGFIDSSPATVSPGERRYSGFVARAAEVFADAAIHASQSAEIRWDRVQREDVGGTLWVPPASYEGDYLRLPVAGPEKRKLRWIVAASRGIPGQSGDDAIDNILGQMHAQPRFGNIPEPS